MKALAGFWRTLRDALEADRAREKAAADFGETAFLPAALEIVERPVSPTARWTARVLMGALLFVILWLILGRIDVVASAPSRLIPADHIKLIQPAQAGVVHAVLVSEGERVRKGQPLVELDPTVSTAEVMQARKALETAELDAARARAVLSALDGGGIRFTPPVGTSPEVAATQQALARAELMRIEASGSGHAAQRQAAIAAREEARIEAAKLTETLPLLDQQIAAHETLLAKGFASELRVIEMRRQRLAAARNRDIAIETANRANAQIAVAGSSGAESRADARARLLTLISTSEEEAKLRREELTKATQRSSLQRLVSPVDGIVTGLSVHTIGGVVEAAKPIMTVVPVGGPLIAETRVLNKDMGFIQAGQTVAIKLQAFPFTRYGAVPGVVESISSNAVEDENLGLVYVARIRLNQTRINRGDRSVPLIPGMAATADIKTGRRSLLSYLLSPIEEAGREAGRER